ncbi:MAG: hypothetical protein ACTTIV_05460 [Campylobacter sp.]
MQFPIKKSALGFSKAYGCDILNGYHISNTNDILKVVFVQKQLLRLSFGKIWQICYFCAQYRSLTLWSITITSNFRLISL